jgi:uncharacterized protein YjbI with pentapeptide repeats
MANDEDLARLRQGAAVWNDWRTQNPRHMVDLRGADLIAADLKGANLMGADLGGANLHWADLNEANLRGANLDGANLGAATLFRTNLREAGLRGADLSRVDLSGANLREANLMGANLRGMDLSGMDLSGANLRGADLGAATLRGANLDGANLFDADLRQTTLIDSCLDGADLTDAKLWKTQRGGWSIKGVICQRGFWDRDGEEPTEFGVGDFERVFAEKPRIVLRYPDGMSAVDLAMLPLIVERLQAKHPDCALHIRSLEDAGSGAVVTITVDDLANRSAKVFEGKVAVLQSELATFQHRLRNEERLREVAEVKYKEVKDLYQPMLEAAMRGQGDQYHNPILIGFSMSEIYNTRAEQIAAVGHVHDNTFQQIWNQAGMDPLQLAQELAPLRAALKQETEGTAEQDEAIGAVAAAEKAADQGDGPTALRHLKAAGKWTLGVAEKIGVTLAAKAIESAMGIP